MQRPTKSDLEAATGKTVPDVIAPGLTVLFVGINPGLYSAAVGHHFARPGNRFWPALYEAGFTPRLGPRHHQPGAADHGRGGRALVGRAAPGEVALEDKVARYAPRWTAFVGIGAYSTAFRRRGISLGPQEETIAESRIWVLPNTSGPNAHYTPARFAEVFRELRESCCSET
ncbi:MAG: mismatch-specific DNA-glycosylase [Actinobacteria bacterium]|nr:mismatch-specific DNA-glycosylase [Actinomycetota bacterium]